MDTWSAFLVFDREVEEFKCYDGDVDQSSGKTFKIKPKGWNAASKAGSRRQISVGIKWPQNGAEPKLVSMTVNGIPYDCGNAPAEGSEGPEFEPVVAEEGEDAERPFGLEPVVAEPEEVVPVEQVENTNSERGVYVSWPKKVIYKG